MTYASGFVLFWGGLENEAEARAYIKRYGLTHDDVKLVKRGEELLIIAKREVNLTERNDHA